MKEKYTPRNRLHDMFRRTKQNEITELDQIKEQMAHIAASQRMDLANLHEAVIRLRNLVSESKHAQKRERVMEWRKRWVYEAQKRRDFYFECVRCVVSCSVIFTMICCGNIAWNFTTWLWNTLW